MLNGGAYIDNEVHEIFVLTRDVDLFSLSLDASEVEDVALAAPDELDDFDLVPHAKEYAILRRHLRRHG